MENATSQQRSPAASDGVRSPWILACAGVVVFHLAWHLEGNESGYWLPGLGIGIALVSWLGWRVLPLLFVDLILVRSYHAPGWYGAADVPYPWKMIVVDAVMHLAVIALSWWVYYHVAGGSRWLDDPRSVTVFLILVPGGLCAFGAVLHALAAQTLLPAEHITDNPALLAAKWWLSRMVGILVILPTLLVVITPILLRARLVRIEMPTSFFGETLTSLQRRGERIELIGLTLATSILAPLLLFQNDTTNVALWGSCLILIVWTCIRQGLRGGCFSAGVTSFVVLMVAQMPDVRTDIQSGLQGDLLAFCSTALLVGVSSSWIRANEARYRHVVSRIPVVLYSARLPQGLPGLSVPVAPASGSADVKSPPPTHARDSRRDMNIGPSISKLATIMLVSPACKEILGCEPETLIGPYSQWLGQIVPEDHELVIAALAQLCLQNQPVTCEYRVRMKAPQRAADPALNAMLPSSQQIVLFRWVRDTMTPHYSEDNQVNGWEGLVEEITEQRALSQNLRKISNMLQVLITNLPTGVFFVQAPLGYPILVNARARQLLGRREDMSAGLEHLSDTYRLHRPDGSLYPSDELPISKALKQGLSCRANDIVVHRADGRKIPLIVWAAPVDLGHTGVPDAAVWVFEDLSAMQQAETALRESETRLRVVIETMGEGVVVQDASGTIIECNPAACAILSTPREQLLNRIGLASLVEAGDAVTEGAAPYPREQFPDQRALRDGVAVRGDILGLPLNANGATRWLLVSALPLPVGPGTGLSRPPARVVTTFADITLQLQTQESLRHAKEKYQNLIETLPFMMVQRDREFNVTYLNPAATRLTGYSSEEMMTPGFFRQVLVPDDLPTVLDAVERIKRGESARVEYRFVAHDQSVKHVLAFMNPNWAGGEVTGSTNVVIDITMQRHLEQELQRARHLELVGKLASGTVHDFNNLVFVMMSLAELAKIEVAEESAARANLNKLIDVGEQASHLAGQILAFGKQRSKSVYPVDLNVVVSQTIKLLNSVMPAEITVETHLTPNLPIVIGNDGQLKQVLMNLCLNARDSMTTGGRLTIRTDRSPPRPPGAEGDGRENAAANMVHVSISDTGHGMEESVRSRIFEPFFSTKERGTGLGMAVVQQIIEEFGGRIEVWSQPGVGTRMDIWLPTMGTGVAESI